MKKKLLMLAMAIALFAGMFAIPVTKTVYASCGCAMECGNRCGVSCDNCSIFNGECQSQAAACCAGAAEATGPMPECPAN